MVKHKFKTPWWLDGGTEVCSICHHLYPYGTGHHCDSCDRSMCQDCYLANKCKCEGCADDDEPDIEIEVTL